MVDCSCCFGAYGKAVHHHGRSVEWSKSTYFNGQEPESRDWCPIVPSESLPQRPEASVWHDPKLSTTSQ